MSDPAALEQPTRSTADVLAGRIRVRLAGQVYSLPVLTIGENEEWQAGLEEHLQPILAAGDDVDEVVATLAAFSGDLMVFLRSYDRHHVLPQEPAWEKTIYPNELLTAVLEVRLAADPMLSFAVADSFERERRTRSRETSDPLSSEATSSWRRRMAGLFRKPART